MAIDISEDQELFEGQGEYQYDIYRLMKEQNGNKWDDYQPRSNVMWLHYLCSKLLCMKYRGSGGPSGKNTRKELQHIHDNLLQYWCCCNSNPAQYERNRRFRHLVHVLG